MAGLGGWVSGTDVWMGSGWADDAKLFVSVTLYVVAHALDRHVDSVLLFRAPTPVLTNLRPALLTRTSHTSHTGRHLQRLLICTRGTTIRQPLSRALAQRSRGVVLLFFCKPP